MSDQPHLDGWTQLYRLRDELYETYEDAHRVMISNAVDACESTLFCLPPTVSTEVALHPLGGFHVRVSNDIGCMMVTHLFGGASGIEHLR